MASKNGRVPIGKRKWQPNPGDLLVEATAAVKNDMRARTIHIYQKAGVDRYTYRYGAEVPPAGATKLRTYRRNNDRWVSD